MVPNELLSGSLWMWSDLNLNQLPGALYKFDLIKKHPIVTHALYSQSETNYWQYIWQLIMATDYIDNIQIGWSASLWLIWWVSVLS